MATYDGPSKKPHDSGVAVAVFVERDGKYLFMKRKNSTGNGTWAVPGGGVEFMEHPDDAAKRELREEIGITVMSLEFIGFSNDTHHDDRLHYVTMLYKTSSFTGEPEIQEPHKCSEIGWFAMNNLPKPLFKVLETKLEDKQLLESL